MASAADAIDRHTTGRIRSTGWKMRKYQFDQVGGTDLNSAKIAWYRGYHQFLDVRYRIPWDLFIAAIKYGRGAIIQGWYAELGAYASQVKRSFNHAVYANEISNDGKSILIYDPLADTAKWIPTWVIRQFCGLLRMASGVYCGLGYVYAAFTRRTYTIASPTTTPGTIHLRFNGVKIPVVARRTKSIANKRRSPYVRSDNLIRQVPKGSTFVAYQKTMKGTNVAGSPVWYGDRTGTIWMHADLF